MSASVGMRAAGFGTNFSVLCHDRFLDHFPGFSIDGMSKISTDTVFLLLTRHSHDISGRASDDLDISDYKAVIKGERYISLKVVVVDEKDTYLRNPHLSPPLLIPRLAPSRATEVTQINVPNVWNGMTPVQPGWLPAANVSMEYEWMVAELHDAASR